MRYHEIKKKTIYFVDFFSYHTWFLIYRISKITLKPVFKKWNTNGLENEKEELLSFVLLFSLFAAF